jgi:hypothetical protein
MYDNLPFKLLEKIIFTPGIKALMSLPQVGKTSVAINLSKKYPEVEYIEAGWNADPNISRAVSRSTKDVIFIDNVEVLSDGQITEIKKSKKSIWLITKLGIDRAESNGKAQLTFIIPSYIDESVEKYYLARKIDESIIEFSRYETGVVILSLKVRGILPKTFMELDYI